MWSHATVVLPSCIVAKRNRMCGSMPLRELLPFRLTAVALILFILFSAITATFVHAQTTSISNVTAPSNGTVGSSVTVNVDVTYSGNNGYVLIIFIFDVDAATYATGTPESPDCASRQGTQWANSALCIGLLNPQSTGSVAVAFDLTFSTPKTYDLFAGAGLSTGPSGGAPHLISDSMSRQDFSITITSASSSPSTSLQTPQTAQSTSSASPPSSNSDNYALMGVGLLAVVVVVVGAIIVNERRVHRKPANVGRIPATEQPKPAPVESKPKSEYSSRAMETLPDGLPRKATETVAMPQLPNTSMYCNQCRAVISRDSKFCKECGSKQG